MSDNGREVARRIVSIVQLLVIPGLFAIGPPEASTQEPDSKATSEPADAAIYRRIDQVRRAASRLRVDGLDRDWRSIPRMADPRGDGGRDPTRDVIAAAIAPTADDLWVMIQTAKAPSQDPWAFYLDLDLWGEPADDVRIELETPQRGLTLRVHDGDNLGRPVHLRRAIAIVRHVVEMRIPYQEIFAALPPEKAKAIQAEPTRPWVRMRMISWNSQQRRIVDRGPTVASYRLIRTPYPLDLPLPDRPQPPFPIALPVRGQWHVLQGPFGPFSHRDTWAYDLVILDRTGREASTTTSKKLSEYHCWDQPIFVPVDGRVARVVSSIPDAVPREPIDLRTKSNEVFVDMGGGRGFGLVHLRQGSVTVERGERVTAGTQVGRVGNSGASFAPHLHLAVWGGRFVRQTMPIALQNVRVGLNPVPDDPWARDLLRWEPRVGYFVQTLPDE